MPKMKYTWDMDGEKVSLIGSGFGSAHGNWNRMECGSDFFELAAGKIVKRLAIEPAPSGCPEWDKQTPMCKEFLTGEARQLATFDRMLLDAHAYYTVRVSTTGIITMIYRIGILTDEPQGYQAGIPMPFSGDGIELFKQIMTCLGVNYAT